MNLAILIKTLTNDRFSGVNLEAFQNEFNLPKTGITSLDVALGFAEPYLAKGSKKTNFFLAARWFRKRYIW